MELRVEQGATILGSQDEGDYPLVKPYPSYGIGRDVPTNKRYRPLVFGTNLSNVRISGGGTIGKPSCFAGNFVLRSADGNGGAWYARFFNKTLKWSRPCLIELMFTSHITIDNLVLKNSAFWTVHPYASRSIIIRNLVITAPGWGANTDGVDPDSCSDVRCDSLLWLCRVGVLYWGLWDSGHASCCPPIIGCWLNEARKEGLGRWKVEVHGQPYKMTVYLSSHYAA